MRFAIHSAPRSGSTWLGEIFNSNEHVKYRFQPLFSYALKDALNETSDVNTIEGFFTDLARTDDDFMLQSGQRQRGELPTFLKSKLVTHVGYKEVRYHHVVENLLSRQQRLRVILLVRDPVEVMSSWINAPKEFNPAWNVDEELVDAPLKNAGRPENFYGLAKWAQSTELFERLSQQFPEKTRLLKYSALRRDPLATTRSLFEFCELDVTPQTTAFLTESATKTLVGTYSVFRGGTRSSNVLSAGNTVFVRDYVRKRGLSAYLD